MTLSVIDEIISQRLDTAALLGSENEIVQRRAWEKEVEELCDSTTTE
jgi:hypothetical protein